MFCLHIPRIWRSWRKYASVVRSLENSTRGSLSRSFLPIRSSAGDAPVTVRGVTLYWKRKFSSAFLKSFPSRRAMRTIFRIVSFAAFHFSVALWPIGYTLLVAYPRYSRKPSNSFDANGGPLSLRRASGNPCVLKIASILLITFCASFFFRRMASSQRE